MKKTFLKLTQMVAFTSFCVFSIFAAPGDIDTSFNAAIYDNVPSGSIEAIVIQPDEKVLIGGSFAVIKGKSRAGIARLNADGTIDNSFNPVALPGTKTIALQADGKIIVGGAGKVVRLNVDGSLDGTFNAFGGTGSSYFGTINDIEVLPDGKIVAVGDFEYSTNQGPSLQINDVIKLNQNGTYDSSFNHIAHFNRFYTVDVQTDGKLVIGGQELFRLNSDGTYDEAFIRTLFGPAGGARVSSLEVLSDGRILVGGNFTTINGTSFRHLGRFNTDGSFDVSFNSNGFGPNGQVNKILPLADGKILIGGVFSTYNGTVKNRVALVEQDGLINNTFNYTNGYLTVKSLAVRTDGKIWVGGDGAPPSSQNGVINQDALSRVNADGSIDGSFQGETAVVAAGYKVLEQPDGKVLVGGYFKKVNGDLVNSLVRLNSDGTRDPSFNQTTLTATMDVRDMIIQSDGKILVGISNGARVYRFNTDGSLDLTISNIGGNVQDLKLLPDGKFMVAGGAGVIKRYNADGTIDPTFNASVNGYIWRTAIQPDGKIVIGGDFTQVGGVNRGRIARLNTDGSLDATFNPPGGASNTVLAIGIQPSGKIIVGGLFSSVNFTSRSFLARLNADGTHDNTFTTNINGSANVVKIQPNGKVLIGGNFLTVNSVLSRRIAKLNEDGTLDTTFNVGDGAFGTVRSIDIQTDGRILITGEFDVYKNRSAGGVARILDSAAAVPNNTPFDFDGDGRADFTVFRTSNNVWYQLLGVNNQFNYLYFGASGDIMTPGDYDGDGKTDISIFRPSSGIWVYASSANGNAQYVINWGQAGDIPLPSDYNGDGKDDFIVFRPSNRTWYRYQNGTASQYSFVAFGAPDDKPVIGDFDGDGKSDPAVFRPASGEWFYAASSQNGAHLRAAQWGVVTDKLVPADYDGDGKTDPAIYRDGLWAIYNSSNNSNTILTFGQAGDIPVSADYDGDGKADIAVFRPSDGNWYLLRSTQGFSAVNFGANGDIPAQSAFVR